MIPSPGKTPRQPTTDQPSGTDAGDGEHMEQEALVDFESEQSFPASDPPGWTLGPDQD